MRERIIYRRIALALASMAIISPLAMHPAMAAAEDEVYDFRLLCKLLWNR